MDMVWTEQLSVGNATLDSDNKKLFGLFDELDRLTKAEEYYAVLRAFEQINACMNQCFFNEKLFAQELDIPFDFHHTAHQNILADILFTKHDLKKGGVSGVCKIVQYAQFLRDWLIKHINEDGHSMKQVLQTRPYDFKVDWA